MSQEGKSQGTQGSGPRAEGSRGWLPGQVTMGEWSTGRDTVHHKKVHRVGHRTQCQGQNWPGRRKRDLLTRPSRKKRSRLGSGELLTWGGKQECRGATLKTSCRWKSSQHSSRLHPTGGLQKGLERGPQSGGGRLGADSLR